MASTLKGPLRVSTHASVRRRRAKKKEKKKGKEFQLTPP